MTTSAAARVGISRPSEPVAGREPRPGIVTPGTSPHGSRIAGLDGIRALAIAAVLVFHLNAPWLPGGFLGVDVFFVVSGFLITTLLVQEHRRTGAIGLRAFWVRRARRLLPALVLCVTVSVLIARLVSGDLLVHVGRQVLGALTFSTNWVEITAGSSYFDQTAPQLFMNFWSLAVEEQFYLVWPLATLLLLRFAGGRSRAATALLVAATSTVLMAALFDPASDATRVYYGTDTHVMGLMIGAALAFGCASPTLAPRLALRRDTALGRSAVPGAVAVLAASFALLDEGQPATFRGGILVASLASAVLVLGVLPLGEPAVGTHPTPWQRLTSHPVATWVGQRSYSIYLWHWPVILLVARDNPSAPGTIGHLLTRAWCVIVTVALADLTHRFIEIPFRRLGFRGVGRGVLDALLVWSRRTRQVVAASVAVTAVVLTAVVVTAPDQSETARMLEANAGAAAAQAARASRPPTESTATSTSQRPGASANRQPSPTSLPAAAPPTASARSTADFSMPTGREIDGYGDSMMVGSIYALEYYFPGIRLDARSNRRWSDGLAAIRTRGADNRRAVVLAFGTNAGTDEADVERVLDVLGPDRMVVLVNLMGPFARIDSDNAALDRVAAKHSNVIVADWADAVRDHPEQLQADRIHPSLKGSHLFAKTVRQALADLSERHTGKAVPLKDLPIP